MTDKEMLALLYEDAYAAMIAKDGKELDRVHDDSFVLVHMTGMRQDKKAFIQAIMNGTLNYFNAETESLDINVTGETAVMTGRSRVAAAVFGGGRHIWRLQLRLHAKKNNQEWKLTKAEASTW